MSQQIVNHSIFAEGGDDLVRKLTTLFKEGWREYFLTKVPDLTIRAIEEITDPENHPSANVFVIPGLGFGIPIPLPVNPGMPADQVTAAEAAELAAKIRVVELNDDNRTTGIAETNEALNVINSHEDGGKILAEALENQQVETDHTSGSDMSVATIPRLILCGWAEAIDLTFIRRVLTSGTKSVIRRCLNPTQDGKRVSREVHEFNYCRTSGQFREAIDLVGNSPGFDELSVVGSGDTYKQSVTTYGHFVDLVELRKVIARVRKVRRLLRSANVKMILQLSNASFDVLEQQLLSEIDLSKAIAEGVAYFDL